jgi:hypothetical protein
MEKLNMQSIDLRDAGKKILSETFEVEYDKIHEINVEEILFKTSNKLYQITRNKYADNMHQQVFFTTIITDIH